MWQRMGRLAVAERRAPHATEHPIRWTAEEILVLRLYRSAMWIPLVVPAGLAVASSNGAEEFPGRFLLFGGAAYASFGAVALFVLRRSNLRRHRQFAWVAPILFSLWLFVFNGLLFWGFVGNSDAEASFLGSLLWAAFALPVGYAFVLAVLLIGAALERVRVV